MLYGEWSRVDDGAVGLILIGGNPAVASRMDMWGIGVVQHIDAAAMELYLSYRQYTGDASSANTTVDFDDFNVVMGGARVRF